MDTCRDWLPELSELFGQMTTVCPPAFHHWFWLYRLPFSYLRVQPTEAFSPYIVCIASQLLVLLVRGQLGRGCSSLSLFNLSQSLINKKLVREKDFFFDASARFDWLFWAFRHRTKVVLFPTLLRIQEELPLENQKDSQKNECWHSLSRIK